MTFLFSLLLPAPLYDYLCSLLQKTLGPGAPLHLLLLHVAVGRRANVRPRTILHPVFTAYCFVEASGSKFWTIQEFASTFNYPTDPQNSRIHLTAWSFTSQSLLKLRRYHLAPNRNANSVVFFVALQIAAVRLARTRHSRLCF